jgi:hypothetical protein
MTGPAWASQPPDPKFEPPSRYDWVPRPDAFKLNLSHPFSHLWSSPLMYNDPYALGRNLGYMYLIPLPQLGLDKIWLRLL